MTAQLRLFKGPDTQAPLTNPSQPITVQEVIDWFLARYTSTSREAITEIKRVLRLFGARFGLQPAEALIGDDLVSFVESQANVKAGNTVKRWYRTIKQPFNEAERLGKIRCSPFKLVRMPRGDRGRDLTPVEFRALLRLTSAVYRRVLIFLRYSGARPKELRQLTWDKIVWSPKGVVIVLRDHKTASTQRVQKPRKIVLPTPLVKLLLWLRGKDPSPSGLVFKNHFGRKWTCGRLCERLRRLREKAGFGKDVKLYGCRHAFATTAILNGVDIATLAELMGHARTSTTEIYLHLAGKDDHLADAAEKAFGHRK